LYLVPLVPLVLLTLIQQTDPLVGTVEDADGKPVAGIEVLLTCGSPPSGERTLIGMDRWMSIARPAPEPRPVLGRCRTDQGGRFRLDVPAEVVRSQEPLPVALWAYRDGNRAASLRLRWAIPAPAAPIRLVLGPPSSVALHILGPDGEPDLGARVVVTALDRLAVPAEVADRAAVEADRRGAAVVSAFGPGEIRRVRVESKQFGSQEIFISDSEASRTIRLEPVGHVNGRVRTVDDKPVVGLKIRARTFPEGSDLGGNVGSVELTTDASGRFTIPAIAAGRLAMTLDFRSRPDLAYRGVAPANEVVEPGRTTVLEIPLKPAVRIQGVIRERGTAAAIPGVIPHLPDPAVRLGGNPRTPTDSEGRYAGYMEHHQPYAFLYATPLPYFIPADSPETGHLLPAGATEYTLPPTELVRGVALRGKVVDEAGKPVGGVLVRASWGTKDVIAQSVAARTDAAGAFLLEGLDPLADLRLTAQARDASTATHLTARAGTEKPVELRIGRANSVALSGRVVDAAGVPVEGAEVRFQSHTRIEGGQIWRIDPVEFADHDALRTDAEGTFRTPEGLPRDGEYQATATARGMLPGRTAWLKPASGESAPFANLMLRRLRAVEGLVRDRQGRPVAGATVLQSGDGPIRSRATTNEQGHFRLPGFLEGKAILFARKDGYRFHGQPIDTEAGAAVMVLSRDDEPATSLKTLTSVLPKEEELALARRLLGPYAEKAFADGGMIEKFQVLYGYAPIDPARVLEMLETPAAGKIPELKDAVRGVLVNGLARESPEEAVSVAEAIQEPTSRSWALMSVCDATPASERARKLELLAQAQLQAKAIKEPAGKVRLLGRVADRYLELGETASAEPLLREGRALANEVTPPGYERVTFAEALARVDLPAALALIEVAKGDAMRGDSKSRVFVYDRSYGEIAYRLAARDPSGAERVLGLIVDPYRRGGYVIAACSRMASVDLPRARRLAATIDDPLNRAYALGLMARSQAPIDRAVAGRLLDDAFAMIDENRDLREGHSDPACVAAVLLPVVERVDPARLEESIWRAISLRAPRPDERREDIVRRLDAGIAMNLARYDRAAASAVLAPALAAFRSTDTDNYFVPMAEALIDPRHVVAMIEGLPDDQGLSRSLPKNSARMFGAEMLGKHGDARWQAARQWGISLWLPENVDF
jgi:hypothetical protein